MKIWLSMVIYSTKNERTVVCVHKIVFVIGKEKRRERYEVFVEFIESQIFDRGEGNQKIG